MNAFRVEGGTGVPPPVRQVEVGWWRAVDDDTATGGPRAGAIGVDINAGRRGVEHVVPPAGEAHAYDRQLWARHVHIYISPTGRSVRVWVDGQEVKPGADSPT